MLWSDDVEYKEEYTRFVSDVKENWQQAPGVLLEDEDAYDYHDLAPDNP